jgi:archaeal flagellar protein FlaJ
MNGFVLLAYRLFGKRTEKLDAKALKEKQLALMRADWPMRAGAYEASLWLGALVAGVIGGLLALPIAFLPQAPLFGRILLPIVIAVFFGGMTYTLAPLLLRNAGLERGKEIDENLPHALNYMLALANSGMPPRDVWASLARAKVFGPLAGEAERILRDLDVFGHDLLTALRHAQERTPSKRFGEFLVGAVSAFQSGVELESYLRNKGEQYQRDAIEHQLKTIDTMALMAEAFLVVVVAAPLFLIILFTVMSINQGRSVLLWGYAMVVVFIPLTQIIIGTIVRSMNPRVWT